MPRIAARETASAATTVSLGVGGILGGEKSAAEFQRIVGELMDHRPSGMSAPGRKLSPTEVNAWRARKERERMIVEKYLARRERERAQQTEE